MATSKPEHGTHLPNNTQAHTIVSAIMREFNQGASATPYRRTPCLSPHRPFLFEGSGCAHYAGAMVYVPPQGTGKNGDSYQGGSALMNVLQVRQYDAHAWVEAFIDGVWVRHDPTSMVSTVSPNLWTWTCVGRAWESREASILGDLSNAAIFATLQSWIQQLITRE